MPSLSARSMTLGVADRAAVRIGLYLGRVQRPRITRSGFWDCHQSGSRTCCWETQRTGGMGDFEFRISECGPATSRTCGTTQGCSLG